MNNLFHIEYFDAWTRNSVFYKKVKAIAKEVRDFFPEYEMDFGITTNDFEAFCGDELYGCLDERNFAESLRSFLMNYDFIYWEESGQEMDEENSNHPKVAKLVNELYVMAQSYLPWCKVHISEDAEKKIKEYISEGIDHNDFSLVERLDYQRWICGGHNCADRELELGICLDGDHALFFRNDMYCGGIIFHGYEDEKKYRENGSVMLSPSYGWSQHT